MKLTDRNRILVLVGVLAIAGIALFAQATCKAPPENAENIVTGQKAKDMMKFMKHPASMGGGGAPAGKPEAAPKTSSE
jgi:hypothetical protein